MSGERARPRVLGALAALLLPVVALAVFSPLSAPEAWIERWLQSKLPNPSYVAVRTLIEREQWRPAAQGFSGDGSVVIVQIGRDRVRQQYVTAEFRFDRFGRLMDLRVEKSRAPIAASAASPGP
jgi:hypothetical protein